MLLFVVGCLDPAPPATESNTPPTPPTVEILPNPAVAWADELRCEITDPAQDADGDDLSYHFTWSHPTEPEATGEVLGQAEPGIWTCTVEVSDGRSTVLAEAERKVVHGRNVLFMLADDLGNDKLAVYGEHPRPSPTVVLDELRERSILFRNAYTNPWCSPTRGALLTGRHPRRFGIGKAMPIHNISEYLPLEEVTIAEVLSESPHSYTSVVAGKWHLAGRYSPYGMDHPLLQGFAHHRGAPGNPNASWIGIPEVHYYRYDYAVDGEITEATTYMTTQTVDDALDLIDSLEEPWFVYVAFNAPHTPLQLPPQELVPYDISGISNSKDIYDTMVSALDTEIGRLLDGIAPEVLESTTVVFMGDNGTSVVAARQPLSSEEVKTTAFEGGINVPLLVAGPWVKAPGTESQALVQQVDWLPTLAEIADVDLGPLGLPLDGESFLHVLGDPTLSHREYVRIEKFAPNFSTEAPNTHRVAVRNSRYKLMRDEGEEFLFDLEGQTWDGPNLLDDPLTPNEQAQYEVLTEEMDRWLDAFGFEYGWLFP